MSRRRKPQADVVGVSEIAKMFGVAKNTAWRWTRREDFPEPATRLASGPVWASDVIARWGRENLPLPRGRPVRD